MSFYVCNVDPNYLNQHVDMTDVARDEEPLVPLVVNFAKPDPQIIHNSNADGSEPILLPHLWGKY